MARARPETPSEARERLRHKINTEGAEVAYNALVSVCRDEKAPAPAKATAGVAILRAAGMFERTDEADEREPHEWSAEQLQKAARKTERRLRDAGVIGPGEVSREEILKALKREREMLKDRGGDEGGGIFD
jgi:DNA replicative helicase MCM subunit Mcm2 (Cdc46/Mcm family)